MQVLKSKIVIAALVTLTAATASAQSPFKGLENLMSVPKDYEVGYVKTAPKIDGDISDPVWQQAKWTEDFVDIEGDLKPHPPLQTKIKMLWDDTCLYVAARVMEPQVWASMFKRDDVIFMDNDVEVFINTNGTTHQYYEIECNAANTIFDLYLNKPYRNGGTPLGSWNTPGMRSAVKIQGTLNDPADTDKGWTMEMAIPFKALGSGNRFQSPKDGTVWRINFLRVEWDKKVVDGKYQKLKDTNGRNLPEHNWAWSPQGVINMHYPERWGYLQFNKLNPYAAFTLPYQEQQKQYLWFIYYQQKEWFKKHNAYAQSLTDFKMADTVTVNGSVNKLRIEATPHQFMALITDKTDNITWTINQEGLVGKLNSNPNE